MTENNARADWTVSSMREKSAMTPGGGAVYRAVKRGFDVAASLLGLIVLFPVFLATAIAIKLEDPHGKVFYHQLRIGKDGREFRCHKFRSMYANADEIKATLMAQNEMDGPVFKMRHDPRITRVGRVIRKLSIDELPQLYNVLVGEMSLVGPRPLPVAEELACSAYQRQRELVKPGLTCYWQVSGRNEIGFDEWVEMDLKYIRERSIWTDVKILAATIPAVLIGGGGGESERLAYRTVKRTFDICASLLGLLATSPILLTACIAIMMESEGSPFFLQDRIGKNCKPFKMIKLRSMRLNAESLLSMMTAEEKQEFSQNFKLKDDPRITKVGRFIRRTSIDELPQLWNVLRGDMSLVGPRPPLLAERTAYGKHLETVMSIRPGITGYWQVHGRSDTNFSERIEMAEYYVEHRGILMDFQILLDTVRVVLSGKGAI